MVGNLECLNRNHHLLRCNRTIHFTHDGILFIVSIFLKTNTVSRTKMVIISKITLFAIHIMVF